MIRARNISAALFVAALTAAGSARACIPPERPFLPQARADMHAYADLIRADFEAYITDVQAYFRCLEDERARVFTEAREVSEDYGRFLEALE